MYNSINTLESQAQAIKSAGFVPPVAMSRLKGHELGWDDTIGGSVQDEKPNTSNNDINHFAHFADIANDVPIFPIDCLPPELCNFAKAVSENKQVVIDMPAVAILAVIALCVQGKFIINPKPGWLEPLNIYTAIIAPPSDRKSPTLKEITSYIHQYTAEENLRRNPDIVAYQTKKNILQKALNMLTEQASKGKIKIDEVIEKRKELSEAETEEVKPLRLIADDVTPEALTSLLADNEGRMSVISTEGGIFDIVAGRYSNSINIDTLLKAYSADPILVDRKGRAAESIPHPVLTMLLTIQPAVLEEIMENPSFRGKGLIARFLYSIPQSLVGERKYETAPISLTVRKAYQDLLNKLLEIPYDDVQIIRFTEEAHKASKAFFEELEPRLRDDLEELEDWAGKYHGQVIRIAGILHCCKYTDKASDTLLEVDTMLQAQTIGEYFLTHAQAAFQLMGLSDDIRTAKYIWKRLSRQNVTSITKKELFDICKGKLKTVDEMQLGLDVLIERGYIRTEEVKTGRRPTIKIYINPLSQNEQNEQN